jgi:serine/threonine protein kinase
VVLYELLTGRLPFNGATAEGSLRQRIELAPLSLRALNPEISVALEAVVLRALSPRPIDRFQSAGDLRDALRASAPAASAPDAPTQRYALPMLDPPEDSEATHPHASVQRRGHRLPLIALGVAGILLAAIVGLLSAASSREAPAAAESSPIAVEPTPAPPIPEPTLAPTSVLAVDPPANPPPAPVSNPGPPQQSKPAPATKVQKNDDKDEKKDEKKSGNQGNGNRGRD